MSVRLKRKEVDGGCVFSWTDAQEAYPTITFLYEENMYHLWHGNQHREYKTYGTARAALAQQLKGKF